MSWNYPDGRKVEPWGKPAGRITYDADGNVLALLMHEQRNQADGKACDPETLPSYSAYFGTYRIDSASGVIRHQVPFPSTLMHPVNCVAPLHSKMQADPWVHRDAEACLSRDDSSGGAYPNQHWIGRDNPEWVS